MIFIYSSSSSIKFLCFALYKKNATKFDHALSALLPKYTVKINKILFNIYSDEPYKKFKKTPNKHTIKSTWVGLNRILQLEQLCNLETTNQMGRVLTEQEEKCLCEHFLWNPPIYVQQTLSTGQVSLYIRIYSEDYKYYATHWWIVALYFGVMQVYKEE